MITEMKKYTFLVFHRDYEAFLTAIREAGVVHIADKGAVLADNPEMQAAIEKADALRKVLKQGAPDQLIQERAEIEKRIAAVEKEQKRMAVWGDFDRSLLTKLAEAGYELSYYSCARAKYKEEWGTIVAEVGNTVYFVVVKSHGVSLTSKTTNTSTTSETSNTSTTSDTSITSIATEEKPGEKSVKDLENDKVALGGLLAAAQARIELWQKDEMPRVEAELREAEAAIEWQRVKLNTISPLEGESEGVLSLLEGFCPVDAEANLEAVLKSQEVYYEVAKPTEEDKTPIKLKNNKITSLFECLTGMYGWPSYGEWDPTPILAPFYLLFFALCMGDMAYGVILIIYGILQTKKIINISMFDGLGPIITALGVATTVVGFFMNTVFGVPVTMLDWHPAKVAGYDFWMVAAIVIGIFHICLAMTVKAISQTQRFGFKAMISTWGWLLLIVGSIATLLIGMAFSLPTAVVEWTIICIAVISALAIYVFNTPGRNPLINIGAGLWDTYNMATGLLGDVLSYIRLYALGLAGGMLGNAFNDLALGMVWGDGEGSIPALIGKGIGVALILLLGHTLNLLMACLGAFVHPLRLTFVEYFKNAGYEGKGVAYNPFKK